MTALLITSMVLAAFVPVITGKASNASVAQNAAQFTKLCNRHNADGSYSFTDKCELCIKNACIACNASCKTYQYIDEESCTCVGCPTGCSECTSSAKCTKCDSTHYLDSRTHMCTSYSPGLNCSTYDPNADKCVTCQTGYYLNSSKKCIKYTVTNCLSYDPNADKCIGCKTGYYQNGSKCSAYTVSNCLAYDPNANKCVGCKTKYYQNGNNCTLCASKYGSNCSDCDANICKICSLNCATNSGTFARRTSCAIIL